MKRPLETDEAGGAKKKENPCLSDLKYAREIQYRLRKQEMEKQQQLAAKGRLRAGKERRRQDSTQTPSTSGSLFLPVCLSDGNYAPVQCHKVTGYCWCVSPEGRPFPDTSVLHRRPNCGQGKSSTHRRNTRGRKQRKGCGRVDRTTFNTNLIKIFRIEYNRLPSKPTSLSYAGIGSSSEDNDGGAGLSEGDRRVLDWKFTSLDSDNDGRLSRAEYRDLRRLVRKAVRPRRCARTFLRYCDLDKDTMISAPEWGACVGLDFNCECHKIKMHYMSISGYIHNL
ncbi:hypothetical protein J437_LFUL001859 [Ladona fulva]|uniref:Thyroglobulin type-1 domain-containing protein n=1 Tax=Ladona fulva TaxID=123851 RepID=A0A8K0JTA8_LADFU|nr:hypothetical protein J437_LFUL001859 [Ladona fulva]